MRDHVDVAGQPADLVAVNGLGARQVAKHRDQLRIVVGLHLVGEQIVALHRVGLDLVGDREAGRRGS